MSNEILNNAIRPTRFTSSQIWKLTRKGRSAKQYFGAPALTYIQEKQIEKRLQSSIDTGAYSTGMAWGIFMERRVFELLPMDYTPTMNLTVAHPDPKLKPYWAGSSDLLVPDKKITEIKCYQKKAFALLTDAVLKQDVQYLKENFEQEYWQIVSNTILNEVDYGELVTYMPYESEMKEIREMAADPDIWGADHWKYRFIVERENYELAVLKDGAYYKNLNVFEFRIPEEDVEFLTERVENAIKLLNEEDET